MKPIVWKKVSGARSLELAFVGRAKVGYARYSLGRSKGDPIAYDFGCLLPSITRDTAFGEKPTVEEAKAVVERLVRSWFKETMES